MEKITRFGVLGVKDLGCRWGGRERESLKKKKERERERNRELQVEFRQRLQRQFAYIVPL